MYFSQVLEDKMRGSGHLSEKDAIEVCDGYVRRWGTCQIVIAGNLSRYEILNHSYGGLC
jgi:hypothetical protein